MSDITCLFRSHHSLGGRSILTLDDCDKKFNKDEPLPLNRPLSIWEIAEHHKIDEIFLYERDCNGLIKAYKGAKKYNKKLRWGIEIELKGVVPHRVGIWLKKSEGYSSLCKLLSTANTTDDFTLEKLKDFFNPEFFKMTVPQYDSFLFHNFLKLNGLQMLDFKGFNPLFMTMEMGLPFDELIKNKIINYCKANNYETFECHPVYYYSPSSIDAITTLRILANRKPGRVRTLSAPGMDFWVSDEFNYLRYLEKKERRKEK